MIIEYLSRCKILRSINIKIVVCRHTIKIKLSCCTKSQVRKALLIYTSAVRYLSQFRQQVKSSFCANFLLQKGVNPNFKYKDSAHVTYVQKAALKMLVKLTQGLHLVFYSFLFIKETSLEWLWSPQKKSFNWKYQNVSIIRYCCDRVSMPYVF